MSGNEENVQLLTEIGFTRTQAIVYLTLLNMEKATGKNLAKHAQVPRQEIYRVLTELEEKGLVERTLTTPYEYAATPIQEVREILLSQKNDEYSEVVKKTEILLEKFRENHEKPVQEKEYKFVMIRGKQRILQLFGKEHDKAQRTVNFVSTMPRWLHIVDECYVNYAKALERGVKYRGIIEKPDCETVLPKNVLALLAKPNFELRLTKGPCSTNCAIFDDKEATFNFYPSKQLAEAPIIWTNHPSLLAMCKDHFEALWKKAIDRSLIEASG